MSEAEKNNETSSSDEEETAIQDKKKPRPVAAAARISRKKPSKQKRPMPRSTNAPGKRGRKEHPARVPQKGKETLHSQWSRDSNWRKVFSPRTISPFIGKSGPQFRRGTLSAEPNPLEYFQLYFTDAVWQLFVSKTNQNDIFKKTKKWKETNVPEMKAFFGLVLAMGILWLPKMRDYWRKSNKLIHTPAFSEVMTRDRFFELYRYLHVSDDREQKARGEDGHDPLFKIRKLCDLILERFRNVYKPGREICIDESLITFKGKIYFRQFIPSKRARFGVKAFVLCDSLTGYVSELQIYTGKSQDGTVTKDLAEKIVMQLVSTYTNLGHHLYLDNYYTKAWLLENLVNDKIYVTGTARVDRSGFSAKIAIKSK